jgi:UrcA family protein
MKVLVGAAAAACLMFVAQPAHAQSFGFERTSVQVGYGDLDLNSTAGAAAMIGRIEAAAHQACGDPSRERNWRMRRAVRDCVTTATSNAVEAANSRTLTAYAASPGHYPRRIELNRDNAEARVRYADLDLSSARGQATLERRLDRAADRLCRNAGDRQEVSACEDASREQAQTQVAAIMSERQLARANDGEVVMASASATADAAVPPPSASAAQPQAISASGYGICAARSHNAAFGASSAALGANARREIGYAVDSASVCALDRVTIAADGSNALARQRAAALRSALIARGVSASQVVIENVEGADGGGLLMQFTGVAQGDTALAQTPRDAGV